MKTHQQMAQAKNGKHEKKILILTEEGDVHADYVIKALKRLKVACIRLHTEKLVENTHYKLKPFQGSLTGNIEILDSKKAFHLNEISGVYYRRPKRPMAPEAITDFGKKQFIESETEALLNGFYGLIGATKTWVNHPICNRNAGNKIEQLQRALSLGLCIPETLVTNQPKEAHEFFLQQRKNVVCKTLKQELVSIDGHNHFIFTHLLPSKTNKKTFQDVQLGSSLLQANIPKATDVRVTLVKDVCFACEIESQGKKESKIDWRIVSPYDLPHKIIELPRLVVKKLFDLQKSYNLLSCQIDLIKTKGNEFFFLELNPNGQWLWLELMTGFPISQTIAKALAS